MFLIAQVQTHRKLTTAMRWNVPSLLFNLLAGIAGFVVPYSLPAQQATCIVPTSTDLEIVATAVSPDSTFSLSSALSELPIQTRKFASSAREYIDSCLGRRHELYAFTPLEGRETHAVRYLIFPVSGDDGRGNQRFLFDVDETSGEILAVRVLPKTPR